ncbi:uncharacterized protein [Elaeis guineensis]|uniref:Uncharacterized protein LOC105042900 isoform X1 n=1 Tax=Elaeis guineensis var. tenera TaxID=51953 RepID=A0A6I9R0T9_ELAGV|nr:uncharacterized protein LOC105042900 isoform X1 [Elaeis guineensis]
MGSEKSGETLSLRKRRPMEAAEEDEEEREIQELEKEVGEMARRLLDFRGTIPDRLMEAFSSRLVAQRPLFSPQIGATSAPSETLVGADSGADVRVESQLNGGTSLAEADQLMLGKLNIFRAKTASNIAAMPVILKRLNECIARIDKFDQYNANIRPVFKRKRK